MSYSSNLKNWGATGSEYPDGYSYKEGEPPVDEYDNFVIYNLIQDVQHTIDEVKNIGVDTDAITYKGNDIDTDGDGKVNSAESADVATEASQSIGDFDLNGSLKDENGKIVVQSVVVSGNVQLSGGTAVVGTGISTSNATFQLALGVDDPNSDIKISGSLFWDDSANEYKIEIKERETFVGNATVNYDVIRVR